MVVNVYLTPDTALSTGDRRDNVCPWEANIPVEKRTNKRTVKVTTTIGRRRGGVHFREDSG